MLGEKEKALELIKRLRAASYNHTYYGTDMAIDEEDAIELVEEIFDVEEPEDIEQKKFFKRRLFNGSLLFLYI